ncbi:TPA: bifunctional glyoxylate/hydroxypyruvate reductase B, partial [Candidatus Collierbacteria bacterium]|nr:bifunctional glyoxylate/hydroxypyruvate reductase B [Candidatus Collierbacteria bacterium]
PHTASATVEARLAMAKIVVDNIADAIENRQPSCLVNPDVWREKID